MLTHVRTLRTTRHQPGERGGVLLSEEAKAATPSEALGGCGAIIALLMVGSCVFGGSDDPKPEPTPSPSPTTASAATQPIPKKPSEFTIYDEPLVQQASSVSSMAGGSGDGLATLLNLNGEICADVVSVTKLKKKHQYDVICVANRDGSGYVRYDFDAKGGTAKLTRRVY